MAWVQLTQRCASRSFILRSRAVLALESTRRPLSSNKRANPELAFVSSAYEETYKRSIEDPSKFWREIASSRLQWIKPFTQVMDCDMNVGKHKWFFDGKLNVSGRPFNMRIVQLSK